jgi:hypothetical protein
MVSAWDVAAVDRDDSMLLTRRDLCPPPVHHFPSHPASAVALEAQAIGRVHRLGQKKPVFVTKFVAKGTVEENVLRWNSDKLGAQAGQAANGGCRSL